MAIAVINHADLVAYAEQIGFPKHTKVKLEPEGFGYKVFSDFIRANVRWVSQLEVDPLTHVRITESANHVGEIPDPWAIRCQKFLEGDEDYNSLNGITVDDVEFTTHVNRAAIQVAVSTAAFRYKVDYRLCEDGSVYTEDHLAVAIFDKAEDSSLSFISDLHVEQLWTTKVDMVDVLEGSPVPVLFKRAYYHDPIREDSHPWVFVGHLTYAEHELWREHNCKEATTLDNLAATDFRGIDERVAATMKATMGFADTMADVKKGIAHLAS